jgi:hypothetical protein
MQQNWPLESETLYCLVHTVLVTFCPMTKYPQCGQFEEGKIYLGPRFQSYLSPQSLDLSVLSQWWGRASWQREHVTEATHLVPGRRHTEEDRRGALKAIVFYKHPPITHFFWPLPTPRFLPPPNWTSYQKPIKGLIHRLEQLPGCSHFPGDHERYPSPQHVVLH